MDNLLIIEKEVFDKLIDSIDLLKVKIDTMYAGSGIAPQKWIDNMQASLRLSAGKRTLQTLRDSGVLPFTKIGAKVFYKPEDIEKLLSFGYKPVKK